MRGVLGCLVVVALIGCEQTRTVDPAAPPTTEVEVVHATGAIDDATPTADAGADASADASLDGGAAGAADAVR
ncbi:MAG: hypothetical protein H6706_21110 [Myxococcales bacterium]|nr:hypothetical protein [Myxococcales bacterium]